MQDKAVTFMEHLEELRIRILRISGVILVCTLIAYTYTDKIMQVIAQHAGHLVFTAPAEAFMTYIKVAFWTAIFVSSPYVIFEIWQFIGEAIDPRERKYIAIALPVSFALFTFGVWFGFSFVIPAGLQFMLSFGKDFMSPMLTVSNYVSFVASMSLSFGIVFQLPVVIALLTRMGLVTPSFLSNKRRIAIVMIFIAAGILTPSPDIFSQFCMAVPLLVLYEVSIIVSRFIYKGSRDVLRPMTLKV